MIIYYTLVFCEETENAETQPAALDNPAEDTWENLGRELMEFEGRTRRHRHHFWCK